MINFGISPYIKCELIKEIYVSPYFVVSDDESLNRIVQDEQMDIQIRYWNESLGVVETRYFDFKFLKRPKAENSYYKALNNCVGFVSLVFEMLCLFRATNKVLFKFRIMIINVFEQGSYFL